MLSMRFKNLIVIKLLIFLNLFGVKIVLADNHNIYETLELIQNDIKTLDIEVLNFEPLNALDGGDDDGTDIIKNLISQIDEKDLNDVEIFLEIDSRFSEKIIKLLNNYEEVELLKDLADKDRYIYARR